MNIVVYQCYQYTGTNIGNKYCTQKVIFCRVEIRYAHGFFLFVTYQIRCLIGIEAALDICPCNIINNDIRYCTVLLTPSLEVLWVVLYLSSLSGVASYTTCKSVFISDLKIFIQGFYCHVLPHWKCRCSNSPLY